MFLLDTNTISHWIRASNPTLQRHFDGVPLSDLVVSSIVEAELRYGIAKRGLEASRAGGLVDTFLSNVAILAWTSSTAKRFARLRTDSEAAGVTIATADLMIATHAYEHGITLVTQDRALFQLTPWIVVADWAS
jgi:tRNA(fMet)-specific endonuclease VapC